jgi:hypothetical protein
LQVVVVRTSMRMQGNACAGSAVPLPEEQRCSSVSGTAAAATKLQQRQWKEGRKESGTEESRVRLFAGWSEYGSVQSSAPDGGDLFGTGVNTSL